MQNKGAIKLFSILLALSCLYYLSFTYVVKGVEEKAKEYAQEFIDTHNISDEDAQYVFDQKELAYLDSMKKEEVYNILITKFDYEYCKEREINLGLDLRGGMNVTLEISVSDIIRGMANNTTDEKFNQALKNAVEQQKSDDRRLITLFGEAYKALDPNGRLAAHFQTIELKGKVDYNTPDEEVLELIRSYIDDAINTSEQTLRARIDKFGVTQPNIQKLEASGRILVELPGVKDKERVRKLLQGTANLEFWETLENKEIYPKLNDANELLRTVLHPKDTSSMASDSSAVTEVIDSTANNTVVEKDTAASDEISIDELAAGENALSTDSGETAKSDADTTFEAYSKENPLFAVLRPALYQDQSRNWNYRPGPVVGYANIKDTAMVNEYLGMKRVKALFPPRTRFMWTFKPFDDEGRALELVAISVRRGEKSPLSGDIITDAFKQSDQYSGGSPQISMMMNPEAAQKWRVLTKENIGKSIAIVLDGNVYSYPTVQNEISGGYSSITGNFSIKEADDLITVLKAGKLPAPARIVEETVVGPTLGKESIQAGLMSFVLALIVVLLYMGFYYNKAGWVADLALFANIFFIMGVLASLGAVLTLPGIAGIVLTIGLSVDANILIFERVREELLVGKGVGLALKEGYQKAMSSIIDANVTTFLLGVILYVFGTGPIQGFATTLCIGILTSLFSAIFLTRLVFERWLDKNKPITFSNKFTEGILRNANFNFVGNRKKYYLLSGIVLLLGVGSMFTQGFSLGVDFKGGRTYVVRYDDTRSTEEVRNVLAANFGTSPEVKTYGESNQHKITTAFLIDDNSEDAEAKVESALRSGLQKVAGEDYEIMSSLKVGETISRDIKTKAVWAILLACIVMFVYIFIRFKRWQYGLGSVIALIHDAVIILSVYSIFYKYLPFSLELDQQFIAAILTVMGYSMNDTVIVFDRLREYLSPTKKYTQNERAGIINKALNSTLGRTLNTSITLFFVLLVIFIFGGETIKGFSFALLLGVVVGTYSSLFVATPIVVDLDKKNVDTK